MKYARATWWIFLSWLARKAHLPTRIVHQVEDEASMAMFASSLDFEPVDVVTELPDDFYEDDEPVADVRAAFDRATDRGITSAPNDRETP